MGRPKNDSQNRGDQQKSNDNQNLETQQIDHKIWTQQGTLLGLKKTSPDLDT